MKEKDFFSQKGLETVLEWKIMQIRDMEKRERTWINALGGLEIFSPFASESYEWVFSLMRMFPHKKNQNESGGKVFFCGERWCFRPIWA